MVLCLAVSIAKRTSAFVFAEQGKNRIRLDELCLKQNRGLETRKIQALICNRKVFVDKKIVDKPGTQVKQTAQVFIKFDEDKYVSRGGYKLEKALEYFKIEVKNKLCLDAGISTGGFTDCLLQKGAQKVYGIDNNYGETAHKLRQDPRVILVERFNVRHVNSTVIPDKIQLITLDLSFISVLKVVPILLQVLDEKESDLVVLIKPQFEAEASQVESGGVIRDHQVHKAIIEKVSQGIERIGFTCKGVIESPIKGARKKNTEFLGHYAKDTLKSLGS